MIDLDTVAGDTVLDGDICVIGAGDPGWKGRLSRFAGRKKGAPAETGAPFSSGDDDQTTIIS